MDLTHMLSALRAELQQIEEAMLALQRLAAGQGKRRGRPPQWMASSQTDAITPAGGRKKRTFSLATRKKMAAAQRRRWAERKVKAE